MVNAKRGSERSYISSSFLTVQYSNVATSIVQDADQPMLSEALNGIDRKNGLKQLKPNLTRYQAMKLGVKQMIFSPILRC